MPVGKRVVRGTGKKGAMEAMNNSSSVSGKQQTSQTTLETVLRAQSGGVCKGDRVFLFLTTMTVGHSPTATELQPSRGIQMNE